MSSSGQEVEVKFLLANLSAFKLRLEALGGKLIQPRIFENNLRFDTPMGILARRQSALRLRQDTQARLTYKGPPLLSGEARLRQEIEFQVSDFSAAQAFLEALGYHVILIYEKYRTTYQLGDVLVTLDEMPYGEFVEIEGEDGETVAAAASRLGLPWESRSLDSYTVLFARVRQSLGLDFRDLSFANFSQIKVSPQVLGMNYADIGGK